MGPGAPGEEPEPAQPQGAERGQGGETPPEPGGVELGHGDPGPGADQLARTVLDDLSETAKPYWTEQAALAVQGDSTARGNLNVLQFSGWSPRAQVTKPGRDTMLRTQAIERGAVDYDATTEEITVRFSYRAIVQMSAQGRPVRLHAKNRPTYWLARQPAGGHLIDSYQGSLVIDEV